MRKLAAEILQHEFGGVFLPPRFFLFSLGSVHLRVWSGPPKTLAPWQGFLGDLGQVLVKITKPGCHRSFLLLARPCRAAFRGGDRKGDHRSPTRSCGAPPGPCPDAHQNHLVDAPAMTPQSSCAAECAIGPHGAARDRGARVLFLLCLSARSQSTNKSDGQTATPGFQPPGAEHAQMVMSKQSGLRPPPPAGNGPPQDRSGIDQTTVRSDSGGAGRNPGVPLPSAALDANGCAGRKASPRQRVPARGLASGTRQDKPPEASGRRRCGPGRARRWHDCPRFTVHQLDDHWHRCRVRCPAS